MSRGVVFLSSVFWGLEATRDRVSNLLRRLGYSVWRAEALKPFWDRKPSSEWTAAICLTGIDESDYYLGIYPSRYGSDPLGIGFTELEYHHATGRRMPRFLYQLYDRVVQPPEQSIKQHGFLNLVRDVDVSFIRPKRIESEKRLLEVIERDFARLACATSHLVSSDFGAALEAWRLFSENGEEPPTGKLWTQRLLALNQAKDVSIPIATAVGLAHLGKSLTESTLISREFLDGFDDYLNSWIGVSAWAGIRGIFGQSNIAKVRISLAQLRGHYGSISGLAGSVSSGLYSDRKLQAADRWYQVYRRNGEDRAIQGAIALALGDAPLACDCFEDVLAQPDIDDANAALHLGYYGVALARRGNFPRAIKETETATSFLNLPPRFQTRVWRARAQALFICGDRLGANFAIDQAEKVAAASFLVGQVQKARAIRKRMRRQASR